MNTYCIKYLMFTKNNKIKSKIDGKVIFILFVLTVVLKGLNLLMKKNWVIYQKVQSIYKTIFS